MTRNLKLLSQRLSGAILVRLFAIIVFIGLLWLLARSAIFTIEVVEITPSLPPSTQEIVFSCLKGYHGENFFSVSPELVRTKLRECYPMLHNVVVDKYIPNKITVSGETVSIVSKTDSVPNSSNCRLLGADGVVYEGKLEVCGTVRTVLATDPEAITQIIRKNIGEIVRESRLQGFEPPQRLEIVQEKGQDTLKVTYSSFVVLLIPSMEARKFAFTLKATVEGLNAKGEPFGEIDLRFDRVIVR